MPAYIILGNFTDQGIRAVKDSPKRADAFKTLAKQHGATVKDIYWTLGCHDVIAIVDAPDDAAVTSLGLTMGMLGNVRTQTLRAFSGDEMTKVLARVK